MDLILTHNNNVGNAACLAGSPWMTPFNIDLIGHDLTEMVGYV